MNLINSIYLSKLKNKLASVKIKKHNRIKYVTNLKLKKSNLEKKDSKIKKHFTLINKKNSNFLKKQNFNKHIHYIFIINLNYSNLFINIINNFNQQIYSVSLGDAKFKSLDKITKKYILLKVFKNIKNKIINQKNIIIHLNSNNYIYNKLIINFCKNFYYIQLIKFFNNLPHNGCRPKKKRRK